MVFESPSSFPEVPWQRVRPISLVFVIVAKLRQWIIPLVVGLYSAQQGNFILIGVGFVVFALVFAVALVRYFTLQFRLAGGELQVREGLFFRSNRTVPVNRIQNIDLVQNVLHRVFRVAEVRIETASGKEPEAILQVLSLEEVEQLRASVFDQATAISKGTTQDALASSEDRADEFEGSENVVLASGSSGLTTAGTGGANGELASSSIPTAAALTSRFERTGVVLLSLSFKQLALAGLASNRGLLLVPIAVGAIYESRNLTGLQNLAAPVRNRLRIRTEDIYQLVPNGMPSVYLVLMLLGGLAAAFVLLKLFSVAWFVIRFYGYELKLVGNDLRIGCGLLTKVSATVPRARIQFISIHRSWLGRKLGLASIRIETAGGGGNENENASQSVARRWFVPVLWESQVADLIEQLRPGIHWTESQFDWRPLSPLAATRIRRFAILAAILLTLVAAFIWQFWGAAIGLVLLPIFLWAAWRTAKAMRYARSESLVLFRSGLMTRKVSCAFTDKIQTLRLSQTPFDRRWKMATLAVDTAAAGPAEHRIEVRYMDADEAQREFAELKRVSCFQVS